MIRTSTATATLKTSLAAFGLAAAFGTAAMAQQASGETTGSVETQSGETQSGETAATVGAPASAETGLNSVYSTKSMMGISTGSSAAADTDTEDQSAAKAGKGDKPASN